MTNNSLKMAARIVGTHPLDPAQIGTAYPLARLLAPDLDLPSWRRFAAEILGGSPADERGIVAAAGEGGYLCGLLIYRVSHDLRHGRVLTADHVIALDIVDRGTVAAALLSALEDLAESLGCDAVQTGIDAPQENIAAVWRGAGHRVEKTLLCKRAGDSGDEGP